MPDWVHYAIDLLLLASTLIVWRIREERIKGLKETIKSLGDTSKAAIELASERANEVNLFKNMHDPSYFDEYLKIRVKVEVEKATAAQQYNLDNEKLKELTNQYEEAINFITFYMIAEKHYDRDKRISFIHTYFDKSKDLIWAISERKISAAKEKMESDMKNIQSQSKNLDV